MGRIGIVGVSAGGLAAIRAFTLDGSDNLDAGVIAFSPLLDVPATMDGLIETGPCAVTQTIELSWVDDLAIGLATGAAFFAGAAVSQAAQGEPLDGSTLLTGGIGFGVGWLGALVVDGWFDGGSKPCVSEHAIANMVEGALRVRWRQLQQPELGETMSAAGRRIEPEAVQIDSYLRERAQYLAARLGVEVGRFQPDALARDLRAALDKGRPTARLLVVGAADDPLTRVDALREFSEQIAGLPQVYAGIVRRGGHGAMWIVQPTLTRELVAQFFRP